MNISSGMYYQMVKVLKSSVPIRLLPCCIKYCDYHHSLDDGARIWNLLSQN